MDIKQLKKEIGSLPNIENLLSEFEHHWFRPIQKNTNQNHPYLQDLETNHKKELNYKLRQLKKSLNELRYGQIVNHKLASLAHNLVELKIASLTNDYRKARRLLNTFLKDPHLSIKQLIFEVPYLESQLELLHNSYTRILDDLSKKLPLEHRVLLDGEHKAAVKKLRAIPKKQKKYLGLVGNHFISLTRDLKKKKEFKKSLSQLK